MAAVGLRGRADREVAGVPARRRYVANRAFVLPTRTAAVFVATIDDVQRFSHAHQLEAYLGLVPREYSSGDTQRRGSIAGHGRAAIHLLEADGKAWPAGMASWLTGLILDAARLALTAALDQFMSIEATFEAQRTRAELAALDARGEAGKTRNASRTPR